MGNCFILLIYATGIWTRLFPSAVLLKKHLQWIKAYTHLVSLSKVLKKTILFSTDGSDEEYETAEDVHDEINPAASTSGEVKSEHPPVYIPEDIPIPDRFELRESRAFPGPGVWTKQLVQKGEKFGPFSGVLSFTSNNSATSWKVGLYNYKFQHTCPQVWKLQKTRKSSMHLQQS